MSIIANFFIADCKKMITKRISGNYVIFLIIAFLYAVGNFVWWKLNTPVIVICPASAGHLADIAGGSFLYFNAPLFTWIVKFCIHLFGKTYFDLIIISVNYVFFVAALYFINKLAVFFENKETACYAMIIFSIIPAVYGMSRQYGHQDFHLIAFIVLNIYALLKTNYFENKKWALLYGISTGLGLMIKDSFFIYFIAPFLYVIITAVKNRLTFGQKENIFLSAAVSFLIFCPHYLRPEIMKKGITDPFIETVNVFSFENLRVTTLGMYESFLSPSVFILFAAAFVFFIFKYKKTSAKIILLLWFLAPWTAVTFMPHHKLLEYLAGILPAQALIIALSLSLIKKKLIKILIVAAVCIAAITQYLSLSYNICNLNFPYFLPFNKYHYLYYYDKTTGRDINDFNEYLFANYAGKKILVYDLYGFSLSCDLLKSYAYLYDKNIKFDYYGDKIQEINENDYIMYIGKKNQNPQAMYADLKNPGIRNNFYIYEDYDFKIKDEIYKMTMFADKKNPYKG